MFSTMLLATLGSLPLHVQTEDEVQLLDLVPRTAFVLVTLEDIDGLREAAAENAWFRMLDDDDVRPFVDHLKGVIARDLEESERDEAAGEDAEVEGESEVDALSDLVGLMDELRLDTEEAARSLSGSVAAFFGVEEDSGDDRGFLGVTFLLGEAKDEFHAVLDRVRTKLDDELESSVASYSGVDLVEYDVEKGGSVFLAETGSLVTFVLGEHDTALEIVQGTVGTYVGEDEAAGFAPDEGYSATRASRRLGRASEPVPTSRCSWTWPACGRASRVRKAGGRSFPRSSSRT